MLDLIADFKELGLHGMASAWPEVQGTARIKSLDHETVLMQLIKAEKAQREVRSMAYQMRVARFPAHRDLLGFDFTQAHVDEALVQKLHSLEFVNSAHNVVLVGGPGTGKTHLATSLGVQAIRAHGKRVRFFSTVELVNALELEKAQNKTGQLAYRLMYVDMVILDEMGYLPFTQSGGALLFHLLSKCEACCPENTPRMRKSGRFQGFALTSSLVRRNSCHHACRPLKASSPGKHIAPSVTHQGKDYPGV